ncbi:flagellin lysine-N-methylase [Clostridium carnis]
MDKVLKPQYYDDFRCIGSDCEANCCSAIWNIDIDKETFIKYRKLKSSFGLELNSNIKRNRKNVSGNSYARIQLNSYGACSMLDSNNLCSVYKKLGGGYLSFTCKTYPRSTNKFNNLYELGLTISCPEACRKILLNKECITFNYSEEELNLDNKKYFKIITKTNEDLYNLFWELRSTSISIVQYRYIPIWKRIAIVVMISEKVQEILDSNGNIEKCYEIINQYKGILEYKDVIDSFDNIPTIEKVKFPVVKSILQARRKMGIIINNKFNEMCINFDKVIGFDEKKSLEDLIKIYSKIEEDYYNKFLKEHEYIIENYLVYNIYNNFMCGLENKDIYNEVIKLIVSYSSLKMLLTTSLAFYKEEFTEDKLIEIFYSFSRVIEHDNKFLNKICDEVKKLGYDKLSYLIVLVK